MRLAVLTSLFLASVGVLGLPLAERASDAALWERDDSLDARDEGFVDISERDALYDVELDARDVEDDLLQSRDIFDIASPLEARAKGPKPPPTTKPKPPKTPATNPKKIANKDARKERKAEKKAEVKAAGPSKAAQDKVRNTQKANAKKEHDIKTKAGQEHKKTTGLPGRKENFNVPAGGGKPAINMNGKDVRQGVYNAHEAHQRKIAANGPKMQPPAFGDKFKNKDHQVPKPGTTKPIDGMTGPGKEHTYSTSTDPAQRKTDHSNNPVRLITQPKPAPAGGHDFKGVIAHDQSRTPGTPGANDHFQVKGTP